MATDRDIDQLPTASESFAGEAVPVIDLNGLSEESLRDKALQQAVADACAT